MSTARGPVARSILGLHLLLVLGCARELPSSPEFAAAEQALHAVESETLDPTWADPKFQAVRALLLRVPPGTKEFAKAQAFIATIDAAQAERSGRSTAIQAAAAADEAASRARAKAAELAPPEAEPQPHFNPADYRDQPRRAPAPYAGHPAPSAAPAAPEVAPSRSAAPEPRTKPEPSPSNKPVLCSFFDTGSASSRQVTVRLCSRLSMSEAQAACDAKLKARGTEGSCDCTDDEGYINGACGR